MAWGTDALSCLCFVGRDGGGGERRNACILKAIIECVVIGMRLFSFMDLVPYWYSAADGYKHDRRNPGVRGPTHVPPIA